VISDDELAAIAAALSVLAPAAETGEMNARVSRWKIAARNPDLDIEDYRRV
jgi:hypothetical protein